MTNALGPDESLAVNDTRSRDARGVPDVDYRGRIYSPEEKDRIYLFGDDPRKGFRVEEGEAGLAAQRKHNLELNRYGREGLEFRGRGNEYWDVVSPVSYAKSGKPVFDVNRVVLAVKEHLLKGNVIIDYGRLIRADADVMEKALNDISESDRRGRKIVSVRNGE